MVLIKVDIDRRRNYQKTKKWMNWRLQWINYYFRILPALVDVRRTRKGFHFRITPQLLPKDPSRHGVDTIDDKDLIIIQQALGSDWLREIRNLNRVKSGMVQDWNILFTEKGTADKVIMKEKYIARYILKPKTK